MFLKRCAVAAVLVVAGSFGSVNAQTPYCVGSQAPVTVNYGTQGIPHATGSISLSYQLCFPSLGNTSSFYWDGTMTYNNVSFDGSFGINGAMRITLNFANQAMSTIAFNGGPLTYTISGQPPYTVSFNNLSYTLNSAFQVGSPTGSLTVNGVNYPADTKYFAYLFR
jgi:hypothetical protein